MKRILCLFLYIMISFTFMSCEKKILNDEIIGTWKSDNLNRLGYEIELYEGGTGKGFENLNDTGYYVLSWEINDDVLTINNSGWPDNMGRIDFKYSDGMLTSVDGETTFYK